MNIVLPEGAFGSDTTDISSLLRSLTEAIHKAGLADASGDGVLGGEFDYGVNFENSTFMMHQYCWCEEDGCSWCAGCTCPDSAVHYFVDTKEVSSREWLDAYDIYVYGSVNPDRSVLPEDWKKKADEINKRRSIRHDPVCNFCVNRGGKSAPNFHHKPSGLKVWWYKWIGRDIQLDNPKKTDFVSVIDSCINSLK